jgi:hypothetical protein
MTRWQGIKKASGLLPTAVPTALAAALGCSNRRRQMPIADHRPRLAPAKEHARRAAETAYPSPAPSNPPSARFETPEQPFLPLPPHHPSESPPLGHSRSISLTLLMLSTKLQVAHPTRPVADDSTSPNGVSAKPASIVQPAPPAFIPPALRPPSVTQRSCSRPADDKPASSAHQARFARRQPLPSHSPPSGIAGNPSASPPPSAKTAMKVPVAQTCLRASTSSPGCSSWCASR